MVSFLFIDRNINDYLSIKDQSAPGHRLLGQIYEGLDENAKALEAYKRSYHLDKKQSDLLLAICRLLVTTSADNETMRQWLAKAEKVYPYHEEVGKLRRSLIENREDPLSATLKDISNCSIHNADLSSLNVSSGTPNMSIAVPSPLKIESQVKSIARTQEQIIRRLVETQESLIQTNERLLEAIGENKDLIRNVEDQIKQLSVSVTQIQVTQKEMKENFDKTLDVDEDEDDYDYEDDDEYQNENNESKYKHSELPVNLNNSAKSSSNVFSRLGQPNSTNSTGSTPATFGNQFAPPADSWECEVCYVRNVGKKEKCNACESPSPFQTSAPSAPVFGSMSNQPVQSQKPSKPDANSQRLPPSSKQQAPLSEMFKPIQGSWECTVCYVQNKSDVNICVSCESPKPGYQPAAPKSNANFTFGSFGTQSQNTTTAPLVFGSFGSESKPAAAVAPSVPSAPVSIPAPVQPAPSSLFQPNSPPQPFSFNLNAQSPPKNNFPATGTSPVKSGFSFNFSQGQQQPVSTVQPFATPTPIVQPPPVASSGFTFGNFTSPTVNSPFSLSKPASQTTPTPSSSTLSANTSLFQPIQPGSFPASESNPLQLLQKHVENQNLVQTAATFVPPTATSAPSLFSPPSFSGFTFGQANNNPPLSNPPAIIGTGPASAATPVTSSAAPSQVFSFGSSGTFNFKFSPITPSNAPAVKSEQSESKHEKKTNESEQSDGEVENDTDDIHFKPVIPLPPKVEVRTGEEGEEVLFCHRARLFRFDNGDWKERGTGDIKVLLDPQSGRYRLLMRREQIHKVCLNHQIGAEFTFFQKSAENRTLKDLQWAATDFSDGEGVPLVFTIRFKDPSIRNRFLDCVVSTVAKVKGEDSNTSNLVTANVDDEVQIVSVKQPSDELKKKARELFLPENFYNYETSEGCRGCLGCEDRIPVLQYEIDGTNVRESIRRPESSVSSVTGGDSDVKPPVSAVSQPVFGTLFSGFNSTAAAPFSAAAGGNLFSAAIDEQGAKSGGWGFGNSGAPKWNTGKVKPIFDGIVTGSESTEKEEDPEAEPNVEFQPIIPLPDLVEVKTGEEEETVLFSNRAKLYRFDNGEWKERGLGDFRLLKNQTSGKVRLLMRREQIHKVCLNHVLTKDLDIKLRENSDKIFQWNAVDFSESNGTPEVLALRFSSAAVAQNLVTAIENAKSEM